MKTMKTMKTMKRLLPATVTMFVLLLSSGIWALAVMQAQDVAGPANQENSVGHRMDGKRVFELEQFAGNGRTCITCHSPETGTVTPAEVKARFAQDPTEPLFRAKDSDDGTGSSYNRLLNWALFTVQVETHANCLPCLNSPSDPPDPLRPETCIVQPEMDEAGRVITRQVTLFRGTGNTINTAPLDEALMLDGRVDNLEDQARGAVHAHYDNMEEPTDKDLQRIAQFQHTRDFFSSDELYEFDNGGPAPVLPPGNTPEEIRGRTFIEPTGLCGKCHSGPMLNMKSQFNPTGTGGRFAQTQVNARDMTVLDEPVARRWWRLVNAQGKFVLRNYHDAGHMLQTGRLNHFGQFRIPSLWNVKNTAPYFHNNSAANLDVLLRHYQEFFQKHPPFLPAGVKPEEKDLLDNEELADIKAFLLIL
jgi:cytochrome c peroxidase